MYDYNHRICKGRHNAYHEIFIVALSNTIIKPNAMMIKLIHTSIANTAMFAVCHAVAVTVLTIQNFAIVRSKSYFFIMPRPFIMIDNTVSWIANGSDGTCYNHDCT
jgi:hypothetical protein